MEAYGKLDPVYEGGGLDALTEEERNALPGYLLEQPSAFAGFDDRLKAAFRTFNGFNFMDMLNSVQLSDNGEFDPERTMLHGALAQLTPFMKLPLEVLMQKNFFTGRSLDAMRGQPLSSADSGRLLTALAGVVGGSAFGSLGGIAVGAAAGEGTKLLGGEELLRQVLGWEEGVDPNTGEPKVWINPYIAHVAKSFLPNLQDAFSLGRHDLHPAEAVMRMVGVGTTKVDLKKSQQFKIRERKFEYQKAVREYKRLLREERPTKAEQARQDIQDLLEQMGMEYAHYTQPVRSPQTETAPLMGGF
jgi:hypothetical protein